MFCLMKIKLHLNFQNVIEHQNEIHKIYPY
jgi:hypothetical protein